MKKGEVMMLDNILSGIKTGKVSKAGVFALLNIKIALKKPVEEIEEARKTAATEFKPAGQETDESKQEWNRKVVEFLDNFLNKDSTVKLEKISQEDFYELVKANDLTIAQLEVLNLIVKGSKA